MFNIMKSKRCKLFLTSCVLSLTLTVSSVKQAKAVVIAPEIAAIIGFLIELGLDSAQARESASILRSAAFNCISGIRNNNRLFHFNRRCQVRVPQCTGNPRPGYATFNVSVIAVVPRRTNPTVHVGLRSIDGCYENDSVCGVSAASGFCGTLIHWNTRVGPVISTVERPRVLVSHVRGRDPNATTNRGGVARIRCTFSDFYNRNRTGCHRFLSWPGNRNRL